MHPQCSNCLLDFTDNDEKKNSIHKMSTFPDKDLWLAFHAISVCKAKKNKRCKEWLLKRDTQSDINFL
jgi:hypothetical protein